MQALAFQAATKSAQRRCFQLEEEARHWQMQVKEQARLLQIAESMVPKSLPPSLNPACVRRLDGACYDASLHTSTMHGGGAFLKCRACCATQVDHAAAGRREAEAAKFHSDLEVLQRKLDTTKRALDFKVNEEAARAELREFDIVERQMRAADEWAEVVATRGGRAVSERGALEDHHEEEVMEHSSAANTAASSRATAPTSRLSGATAGTPSRSGKASGLPLPSTRTKLTGATPPRRIPAASSSPSTTPRHATSSSSPTTPRRIAPTASSPSKANGTRANSSPLDNAMVPYIAEQGEKAIRKVGDGLYSIRNKHHTVVLRNEHLLLRVGGGFMTLDEYLTRRAV